MADKLNNLGWFYRGKMEQQFGTPDTLAHQLFYTLLATCTITGFLYLSGRIFDFCRLIFSLFVLPGTSVRPCRAPFSKLSSLTSLLLASHLRAPSKTWAVITGASDGIGKEFAFYLARAGYSTLLISRTQSKLDSVATEVKQKYNTPTKTLAMDFAANRDSDYAKLKALVDGLDIAILINNVGASHSIPVPFLQTTQDEIDKIITINCAATLRVTQPIAAGMVQRKRGLILTMGSFGGLFPTPLLATYSGSKAFLQQWSTALGSELAPKGITVELVQSYLVTSNMSKIRKSSFMVPTPRQFVRATMGKIGRTGGAQGWAYTSTPYWAHAMLQWGVGLVVSVGNKWVVGYNGGAHVAIRKRALKKMERDAKKQ